MINMINFTTLSVQHNGGIRAAQTVERVKLQLYELQSSTLMTDVLKLIHTNTTVVLQTLCNPHSNSEGMRLMKLNLDKKK